MYYFIVNPKARSKKGKELWAVIDGILKEKSIPHKVFFTRYAGHGTKLAHSITERDPKCTLVAVGGDGTVHEVLTGITNHETITFGCIPSGSGNDFARGMGLSTDPVKALENILHPSAHINMDIGCALCRNDKQRFGVSCGFGFDAGICHEALASPIKNFLNKLHLGKLTYAILAAKQILLYDPCPISITMNGNRHYTFEKAYFVAAFNQKVEGGGLMLAPKAHPDDGFLDVLVVEGMSRFKILLLLPLAYGGLHTHLKGVHLMRCKTISIKSRRKLPIHLDGESGGIDNSIQVSMEKTPLKVFSSISSK